MADPFRLRVESALREHRPVAPEDAAILLRDLDAGRIGETAQARRFRRDGLIRELAAFHRGKMRRIALDIETKLRRYAAIGFPRDVASGIALSGERALLFEILELGDGKPLKFDALYKLLREQ